MLRSEILNVLTIVTHNFQISARKRKEAVSAGILSVLKKSDPELLWAIGSALIESKNANEVSIGRGLLFAAAMEGEKTALNSLAISLEQKGTSLWQREIAQLAQLIGAKNGDPIAMWNMYYTYKKSDSDRAIRWLMVARKFNDDYEIEMQRLLKSGKASHALLKKLVKRRPW